MLGEHDEMVAVIVERNTVSWEAAMVSLAQKPRVPGIGAQWRPRLAREQHRPLLPNVTGPG